MTNISGVIKDYKYSSSGMYSDVYIHPTKNLAVKVNKVTDPAYHEFATYLLKNKINNPYLPKIFKIMEGKPDNYIYFMEKLNSVSSMFNNIKDSKEFFLENIIPIYNMIRKNNKCSNNIIKNAVDIIYTIREDSSFKKQILFDLHLDNIMLRKKQLVIIDPFVLNMSSGYSC